MRARSLAAVVMGAALVLSGCGAAEGEAGGPAPVTGSAAGSATPGTGTTSGGADPAPAAVADTLKFTGRTVDGATFEGSSLAGKPAVLWFWAPWCPTCRAQAPQVEKLAAQHSGSVAVVGVGGLSDASAIRDFAGKVEGPTHLVDEKGSVWKHFGVTAQSTFVLLDASGKVVGDGYLDNDDLAKQVAALAG